MEHILAELELRRRNFHTFVSKTFPEFIDGWFYHVLCKKLAQFMLDVRAGRRPRLILSVPPRHGKSEVVSVRFALWCLLNNPDWEVVVCSYGQDLAEKFSRRARHLLTHPHVKSLWEVNPDPRHSAVREWTVNAGGTGGTLKAVGRGGALTGSGAHCLVADTMILCYDGTKRIADLQKNDLIICFNHSSGKLAISRVKHIIRTEHRAICKVTTEHGKSIQCSTDHRIFCGDSYKFAIDTVPGDRLVSTAGHMPLQSMRNYIHEAKIRSDKVYKKRVCRSLLFGSLFRRRSRDQKQTTLQNMWNSNCSQDNEILQGLQTTSQSEETSTEDLPNLQENISTSVTFDKDLWNKMRKPSPLETNEKERQSEIRGWEQLSGLISEDKGLNHRTRLAVFAVRKLRKYRSSPYRRRQTQQYPRKYGHYVQVLSRHISQVKVESDHVRSIEVKSVDSIPMYDIEVEDFHNFFANGILVHNCLIIDDPLKDTQEADSHTVRELLWDWYGGVARTRLAPGGGIIVIETRWHVEDLVGKLLYEQENTPGADQWEVLQFQAIAEQDEEFRKAGEALHPERFPLHELEAACGSMAPRLWQALFQQSPITPGGNMVKVEWFRFYNSADLDLDTCDQVIQVWDLRFGKSQKKTSSYVVGQVWARKGSSCFLIDQVRERWSFAESKEQVRLLTERYPQALAKLIENKANGPALESDLCDDIPGLLLIDPRGDKIQRLERVIPLFMAGNVFLPKTTWLRDYQRELTHFPNSANDDQVDCTSMALGWFHEAVKDVQEVTLLNI